MRRPVIDWSGTPQTLQLAQVLILATTALLIGSRFLPARFRHRVGVVTTIGYVVGVVTFVIGLLLR